MFSTLIPLYLINSLGGTLFDLGVMTSIATLLGVPASIFFGQLPDRFGRTKPFILISFLAAGVLLFFLSNVKSIIMFQILYILVAIADSLHPTSTSVLIAESHHKEGWGKAFARYNFVIGIATAVGLAICSAFIMSVGYQAILLICSPLVLASFIIALFLVKDPPLYIERWISNFERPIGEVNSFSYKLDAQRYLPSDMRRTPRIRNRPRMIYVGLGFMIFSFAANCASTSLPIFLTRNAAIPSQMVFTIFMIRSIVGTLSYVLVGKWISGNNGEAAVKAVTGLRTLLVLLLFVIALVPASISPFIATIILSLFSFSWSLFSVGKSTVIMEYASEGSLGAYDALDGFGSMMGGLLSGFIPAMYGFNILFMASSAIFASAFLLFVKSLRS